MNMLHSEMSECECPVIRNQSSTDLQEIAQHFSLTGERVHHVLLMVRDRCLEEER